MKLFLIRHGRPVCSGVCYGQTDVPCEPVPDELVWEGTRPRRIVASDIGRCRELAARIAAVCECPLEFDPNLRELDFGEWEGRSWDALAREEGPRFDRWMANYLVETPPGGESHGMLAERVGRALAAAQAAGDDVAWVTHAGPIRVAVACLLGLPSESMFRFEPPFLGRSVLRRSTTGWSLAAWGVPLDRERGTGGIGGPARERKGVVITPLSDALRGPASANAAAWDRLAAAGAALARPAVDAAFTDPRGWLGGGAAGRPWLPERLDGLEVLCLAAGGGKHGPLYAAAGARVTVVDLSPAMLALDRQVARERKIDLEIVQGSMDDLGMLAAGRFDLVIHPVSTCYLPDVGRVFREVARVTRPGGLYVSQHKAPASLQAGLLPGPAGRYELIHPLGRTAPLPAEPPSRLREAGTQEFVHSLSALLGGICAAGFAIEDFCEPDHRQPGATAGSFAHRAEFLPPYLRILARRAKLGTGAIFLPTPP